MQKEGRRAAVLATDEGQAKQGALYLGVERFTNLGLVQVLTIIYRHIWEGLRQVWPDAQWPGQHPLTSLRLWSGSSTVLTPARKAPISFSLMPPTGMTRPRRETSPVMAIWGGTGLLLNKEIKATAWATTARTSKMSHRKLRMVWKSSMSSKLSQPNLGLVHLVLAWPLGIGPDLAEPFPNVPVNDC
jgi:hypothetical protein